MDTYRRVAAGCGSVLAGLGIAGLLHSESGWGVVVGLRAFYAPMALSTKVAFVILGTALLARGIRPAGSLSRWSGRVVGLAVWLLSCVTLGRYARGGDFGADQLLRWLSETPETAASGHLSPITAAGFLLGSSALLLLSLAAADRRRPAGVASGLAIAPLSVGLVAALGYLYNTPLLYGKTTVQIALPTAAGLVCLGVGLLAVAGSDHWPIRALTGATTRTRLLRAFLPYTLAIVVAQGWLNVVIGGPIRDNPALLSALLAILAMSVMSVMVSHTARALGGALERAEAERVRAQEAEREAGRRAEEAFRREQQIAARFQSALLPSGGVCLPGYTVAFAHHAAFAEADVGGDFYNVFAIDEDHFGLVMGDVGGKGLDAAVIAARVQHSIRAMAMLEPRSPAAVLDATRHMLSTCEDEERLVTVFFGVLDLTAGRLRYTCAGHEPPLLWRAAEDDTTALLTDGIPFCGLPAPPHATREITLSSGDLLLLYTDGLTDAGAGTGKELLGRERIQELLSAHQTEQPAPILDELYHAAVRYSEGRLHDDIALLAIRRLAEEQLVVTVCRDDQQGHACGGRQDAAGRPVGGRRDPGHQRLDEPARQATAQSPEQAAEAPACQLAGNQK